MSAEENRGKVIYRLMELVQCLAAADVADSPVSINQLTELMQLNVHTVRRDIYNLYKAQETLINLLTITSADNLEIQPEDIIGGNLDDEGFMASRTDSSAAYLALSSDEIKAIKALSERWELGLEELEEFDMERGKEGITGKYRVSRDNNEFARVNKNVHEKLKKAIDDEEFVRFRYRGARRKETSDDKIVTIKPLRIVEYSSFGMSYVVAVENGRLVSFRLDRIQGVTSELKAQMEYNVTPDEEKRLLDRLRYMWNMDSAGECDVKVKVYNEGRVVEKFTRDIKEYVKHAGYETTMDEEGNMIMTGHVIGKNAFKRFLRMYGSSVVVLEPESMARDMIRSAKKRLEIYGERLP